MAVAAGMKPCRQALLFDLNLGTVATALLHVQIGLLLWRPLFVTTTTTTTTLVTCLTAYTGQVVSNNVVTRVRAVQDVLRLLNLWFRYGGMEAVKYELEDGFKQVR